MSGRRASITASNKSNTDDEELYQDSRAVVCLRVMVVLVLMTAASLVGAFTFMTLRTVQQEDFEQQYYGSVSKISEGFQNAINSKIWSASTFSAVYTSQFGPANEWPNATMPDFEEQAYGQLQLSNGRALSFNPIITQDTRESWEAFATENAELLGAPSLIERSNNESRIVADGIFTVGGVDDTGEAPGSRYPTTMVPVWQIAPIEGNSKAVMFNLHSVGNRQRALDDMMYYKVTALTSILQLVQDSELRPSSILFFPVFDNFLREKVVASISIVFSWDDALRSLLPEYINGIVCVIETSVDQYYTYSINGDEVTIVGEGDLHDTKYDSMRKTVDGSVEGTEAKLGVVDNLITYKLNIYPSTTLENQYMTNTPAMYTTLALLIFAVTSAVFLLYDVAIKHKQSKIVQAAARSTKIVDSFFPAAFRDRLFNSNEEAEVPKVKRRRTSLDFLKKALPGSKVVEKPSLVMKRFLMTPKERRNSNSTTTTSFGSEPIADLFPSATVMFADIAGFTTWSSNRDPSEVFILLETLFKDFDDRSERFGVFKISTIGDCYLACCGLPEARDDHAESMAQFATECQASFDRIVENLDITHSLDASALMIRTGLHSGPVTAGVLRGLRSRFEVFGDTVNTASRMESTGIPKKIQISQETASLLVGAGKKSWIQPRDGLITAKGKGQLQTYWLDIDGSSPSPTKGMNLQDEYDITYPPVNSSNPKTVDFTNDLPPATPAGSLPKNIVINCISVTQDLEFNGGTHEYDNLKGRIQDHYDSENTNRGQRDL